MKRILIILFITYGVAFSNCYAQTVKNQLAADEEALIEKFPCMEESLDTMEEMRGYGVGEGESIEQAKQEAIQEAFKNIMAKMPQQITSTTTETATGIKTITIIEDNISEEQKMSLRKNTKITCYHHLQTKEGKFIVYIVISTPIFESRQQDFNPKEIDIHNDSIRFREELKKIFDEYNN